MHLRLLTVTDPIHDILPQFVALLVGAATVGYVCHRFGIVPILGFLLAGVIVGPNALGLVRNREVVDALAEVGVILLLFTIGMEFRLERLLQLRRLLFLGGGAQVALTIVAVAGVLLPFGVGWRDAVFTGCLVSLSSTAIVLKLLADRHETSSRLGQVSVGVLIFQDLAVVLMVMFLPLLGGGGDAAKMQGGDALVEAGKTLLVATIIIAAVLVLATRVVPPLLEIVARTCAEEIFLLTVLAICLTAAWITSLAGVSLALGAFLAGLLVSGSRFRHHAIGEVMPLQLLFSATFFASVGMLLDVRFLLREPLLVAGMVLAIVAIKTLATGASVWLLDRSVALAGAAGLLLAQVGEFAFVLSRSGQPFDLTPAGLGERGSSAFVAATVVLMAATPALAAAACRLRPPGKIEDERTGGAGADDGALPPDVRGHVIIDGYGRGGALLARGLRDAGIPFVVVTRSPHGATEAEAMGARAVVRAPTSRLHSLRLAGIDRARALVALDDDPETTQRLVVIARDANSSLPIFAAVPEADADGVLDELRRDGATEAFAYSDTLADELIPRLSALDVASGALADNCPAGATCGPAPESTSAKGCTHTSMIRDVSPRTRGCEECLKLGDRWVHLRMCRTCGHVGCCDSSKNKHASKHAAAAGHPIARSIEPGEDWSWCYVDEVYVSE